MCRWIAYQGPSIALEHYVTAPAHSLVEQSRRALEATASTNGDGFGLGWYGEHDEPGLYREVRPAWSDENLHHLCRHIRSHLFFAHVRASTGTPTTRSNCHPFVFGRWMFMHNGQVGEWARIRRKVEALILDEHYAARVGTTDSEAVFLAILSAGADRDPVGATLRTLQTLSALVRRADSKEALRFTSALTDGRDLYAFCYASAGKANTLYYREGGAGLSSSERGPRGVVLASEPLDGERDVWKPVPPQHVLVARRGEPVRLEPITEEARTEAA